MSAWTAADRRIGLWSALSVVLLGVAYLLTGLAGMLLRHDFSLNDLPPEPFLSILRVLMILLAAVIVVLFSAVHAYAAPERKIYGRVALAFATLLAALTSLNNFLLVTALRQTNSERTPRIALLLPDLWPTVILPLELFAWGPLFGLALLFAAPVFSGEKLQSAIRAGMVLGGTLCVANVLCFVTGNLRFSLAGIIGYDFVFPVVCVLLAILFYRSATAE